MQVTKEGYIRIKRKRCEPQDLILNYETSKIIDEYLQIRPRSEYDELFLSKNNKPISNRGVQWLFKKYAVLAKLPEWAHVDSLRITNFTHKLAKGDDVKTVQHHAGHKKIASTTRYLSYVQKNNKNPTLKISL